MLSAAAVTPRQRRRRPEAVSLRRRAPAVRLPPQRVSLPPSAGRRCVPSAFIYAGDLHPPLPRPLSLFPPSPARAMMPGARAFGHSLRPR